ncbi:T9SS type A sorting domain-containing protein [Hymenobacter cellulosilyticus]|uniref:T9SS type A sorting domain-containing protein n=1 Tax=Hymenobacter cellulosilyticus TaxID=2932248 RepID=A0A8T9Q536_9BACT|nr:T9SS type A sorting domain-containing protein [Hymenobacter cellulosilyticus]UOQ71541.1 T9SS type A sorting domain-containing protein [Hymenobacter cellulosilyticus]
MKPTFTLLVASLLLAGTAAAQVPAKNWDHTFGGSDEERLASLLPTADGGYILAGTSASPASGDKSQPGRGEEDIWVVKVTAAGTKQWDRTLGGSAYDGAARIVPTADGGYLIGGYSSSPVSGDKSQPSQGTTDYWLIKLDAQGTKIWDHTFGGSGNDILTSLQATPDGGYLAGGNSNSPASGDKSQASQGGNDYWLLKLDAQGSKQWDHTYGGSSGETLANVQVLADGSLLLGGSSRSGVSGHKTQPNQGDWDYWLLKTDAQGGKLWDRTWGGSGSDYLSDLQLSAAGTMLLAGRCTSGASGDKTQPRLGEWDYWVLKADAQGRKLWDQTVGTAREDLLNCLLPTTDGGCLLGGSLDANAATYAVVKLDGSGTQQWTYGWGGDGTARLVQLQPSPDGGYLLGGMSNSNATGDKSQPNQGGPLYGDYWVVKLAAGQPLPVETAAAGSPALLAFPNPASRTVVQLRFAPPTSPVYLVSTLGRVVRQWPGGTTTLDLQHVAPGAYFVRAGRQTVRLLVH